MSFALKQKKMLSMVLIAAMIWSIIGAIPLQASAAAPNKVVLVGNLQSELGAGADWDPAAGATEMMDSGSGYYSFTAVLPAGDYEYKVALNGGWDESYGFDSYTKPGGEGNGGNIKLSIAEATEVTFYYNHAAHKIADSTYYAPLAGGKLPRIVGNLQTEIGDSADWAPQSALSLMDDSDFDSVYTITKDVPKGDYEFKIVLGTTWEDEAYPQSNQALSLPEDLPVTFKYNAKTNEVSADFQAPVEPEPVGPGPGPGGSEFGSGAGGPSSHSLQPDRWSL